MTITNISGFFTTVLLTVHTVIGKGITLEKSQGLLIIGGEPATQGQFPYQLQILRNGTHACGASLIQVDNFQVALTAAQCALAHDTELHSLVAGELDYDVVSGFEQVKRVAFIANHQSYGNNQFDISLLFFNGSFELNENVQVIPLPRKGQVTMGNITVTGWGAQAYGSPSPPRTNVLHYMNTTVVGNEKCADIWKKYFEREILNNQLCAGEPTGTISPCFGDSGSPARSETGYLAGIVSWGYECGHAQFPGVFTKVSHFVDWIENTVAAYKRGEL